MESGPIAGFDGEIHLRANSTHGLMRALEEAIKVAHDLEIWSIGAFGVPKSTGTRKPKPLQIELNYKGQGIPITAASNAEDLYALWKPHFERAKAKAASR